MVLFDRHMSKKIFSCILLIAVNILLASWFVLHGDIIYGYSGDIARDMYLMQQTLIKKVLLIGAHSGGIPGLFHGPAWIYLNLPAFFISNGNPIGVGWFWILLILIALGINYLLARKLFNTNVALISCLLYSVFLISPAKELINPFGAVLLFLVFFYSIYLYYKKSTILHLVISLLLIGFMIQFQVAFGGPMLILTTLLVLYRLKRTKKWFHLLAYGILIIPFSTYIVFEIRHEFLQVKSVYKYLNGTENFAKQPIGVIVLSRIRGFFLDGLYILKSVPVNIGVLLVGVYGYFLNKNKNNLKHPEIYKLFIYFYGGYWLLNFLYKGIVFDYYYWPFLPLVTIIFASTFSVINRKVFIGIFLVIYLFTFWQGYKSTVLFGQRYIAKDVASWQFNKNLAESVYNNNDKEFGYFIFTPDLHATGTKYAMYYVQKNKNNKGFLNTKKRVTYLIFAPPLKDQEYNNGIWWKTNQVNINREPDSVYRFANGFRTEKYVLTDAELSKETDPGLVNEFKLDE